MDNEHKWILRALRTHALMHGEFTLASGAKSEVYLDCRQATFRPVILSTIGRAVVNRVRSKFRHVGGMELGAIPIVNAVSAIRIVPGFAVRKSPKVYGVDEGLIVGPIPSGPVLLVEDVVTTGISTLKAIKAVEDIGGEVVKIVALVDRGGVRNLREAGYDTEALFTMDEILAKEIL